MCLAARHPCSGQQRTGALPDSQIPLTLPAMTAGFHCNMSIQEPSTAGFLQTLCFALVPETSQGSIPETAVWWFLPILGAGAGSHRTPGPCCCPMPPAAAPQGRVPHTAWWPVARPGAAPLHRPGCGCADGTGSGVCRAACGGDTVPWRVDRHPPAGTVPDGFRQLGVTKLCLRSWSAMGWRRRGMLLSMQDKHACQMQGRRVGLGGRITLECSVLCGSLPASQQQKSLRQGMSYGFIKQRLPLGLS